MQADHTWLLRLCDGSEAEAPLLVLPASLLPSWGSWKGEGPGDAAFSSCVLRRLGRPGPDCPSADPGCAGPWGLWKGEGSGVATLSSRVPLVGSCPGWGGCSGPSGENGEGPGKRELSSWVLRVCSGAAAGASAADPAAEAALEMRWPGLGLLEGLKLEAGGDAKGESMGVPQTSSPLK